ncbi:MAG: cob(I)yrinic acid a,c-diamide adenosyltransferase [Candidatus Aenigmarchaeota archaeon]|nr:cob(I)yrinic acid a,c-diamide adenosyltransferase [Candidatus Aenigmarchaeota archaeon]
MNKPVETLLFGGKIVRKDNVRIEAYGNIDELDSFLGLAYSKSTDEEIKKTLLALQKDMYIIGSDLASTAEQRKNPVVKILTQDRLDWINKINEEIFSSLPPLHKFILQGGSELASMLHVCRTICRRAERKIIELSAKEDVNPIIMDYMNKLSKLLFNLARLANKKAGVNEMEMD